MFHCTNHFSLAHLEEAKGGFVDLLVVRQVEVNLRRALYEEQSWNMAGHISDFIVVRNAI